MEIHAINALFAQNEDTKISDDQSWRAASQKFAIVESDPYFPMNILNVI
jgi:hypothetical protein